MGARTRPASRHSLRPFAHVSDASPFPSRRSRHCGRRLDDLTCRRADAPRHACHGVRDGPRHRGVSRIAVAQRRPVARWPVHHIGRHPDAAADLLRGLHRRWTLAHRRRRHQLAQHLRRPLPQWFGWRDRRRAIRPERDLRRHGRGVSSRAVVHVWRWRLSQHGSGPLVGQRRSWRHAPDLGRARASRRSKRGVRRGAG